MRWFFWILFFLIKSVVYAAEPLWPIQNEWSSDWEQKYSEWIKSDVDVYFFKKYNIKTDCADAAIYTRWIFSRNNHLPAAQTLSDGKLFTTLSEGAWSKLSSSENLKTSTENVLWFKDQKFLSAMSYLVQNSDSQTLIQDTYPIQISASSLSVGALYVTTENKSGHIEWISNINLSGLALPIQFVSSTVPAEVRELLSYPMLKDHWPEKNKNGFMKFRWAIFKNGNIFLNESSKHFDFSLEQYQNQNLNISFDEFVYEKLMGRSLEPVKKYEAMVQSFFSKVERRIQLVRQGFEYCQKQPCKKDTENYYNYSTPSRDAVLTDLARKILKFYDQNNLSIEDSHAVQDFWNEASSAMSFQIENQEVSLSQLVNKFDELKFSSDPNDSIDKRWGF